MATTWSAYEYQPSFILGFHGCDKTTGEKILRGDESHLRHSEEEFDWLGHGIYFWEGNPSRAMQWAEDRKAMGKIQTPFVIGAIIDLGRCLDLFDHDGLVQVKTVHSELKKTFETAGVPVPKNVGSNPDKAGRRLDCAVLNSLHKYREKRGEARYDSVRAPFLEGKKLYSCAGFRSANHIQICVRETACIKGYFLPIPTNDLTPAQAT